MKAKEIMTKKVITIKPTTTVLDAIDTMINHAISGTPVVDDQGKLVGIVSEKDLMVVDDFLTQKQLSQVTVSDFMTKDVVSVTEETPANEVAKMFIRKNIKRVPVIKGDQILGVVSRRDVLKSIRMSQKA